MAPCRCRKGTLKNPTKCLWRREPDRMYNFFFSPLAHLCRHIYNWNIIACDVKHQSTQLKLIFSLQNFATCIWLRNISIVFFTDIQIWSNQEFSVLFKNVLRTAHVDLNSCCSNNYPLLLMTYSDTSLIKSCFNKTVCPLLTLVLCIISGAALRHPLTSLSGRSRMILSTSWWVQTCCRTTSRTMFSLPLNSSARRTSRPGLPNTHQTFRRRKMCEIKSCSWRFYILTNAVIKCQSYFAIFLNQRFKAIIVDKLFFNTTMKWTRP